MSTKAIKKQNEDNQFITFILISPKDDPTAVKSDTFISSPSDVDNDTVSLLPISATDSDLTTKLGFDDCFIKLRDNEASTPLAIVCFRM